MTEIWKDVRDYEGLYQVSNYGRVKSLHSKNEIILKPWRRKKSKYLQVMLYKKGQKPCRPYLHRLVFEAFYRRLLPNEDCHHINKICNCNISTNLVAKDSHLHRQEHHVGKVPWNKGKKASQQTKQKLSKVRKGKKLSQQTKTKISLSKKGSLNPNYGKHLSKQSIKKMLQTRKKNNSIKKNS